VAVECRRQPRPAPARTSPLRELIPNAARFGVLADPASVNTQSAVADLQAVAPALGLELVVVNAKGCAREDDSRRA
jgi:ABC-type uncharacterized transport system substrate-binding protein